jgi:hypothetical protein
VSNVVILAEHTAKVATREEDRTRTIMALDARLCQFVVRRFCMKILVP